MVEFLLLCSPSLAYVIVHSRGEGRTFKSAWDRVGASRGSVAAYRLALLLLPPLLLTAWLSLVLVPSDVLEAPGVSIARLASVSIVIGVALRAQDQLQYLYRRRQRVR